MDKDLNSFVGDTLLFFETLISSSPINGELAQDLKIVKGGEHSIVIKCIGATTDWHVEVNTKEVSKSRF